MTNSDTEIIDNPKETLDDNPADSNAFIRIKHLVAVCLLGVIVIIVGFFFKAMSWPYGSILLLIGTTFEVICILALMIKIMTIKNPKSVLNK